MKPRNEKYSIIMKMNQDLGVECWAFIPNTDDRYAISVFGNVYSLYKSNARNHGWRKEPRMLKKQKIGGSAGRRYHAVGVAGYKGLTYVHRLMVITFKPKCDSCDVMANHVDHIDGDRTNNSLINLRWCTQADNNKWAAERKAQGKIFNSLGCDLL